MEGPCTPKAMIATDIAIAIVKSPKDTWHHVVSVMYAVAIGRGDDLLRELRSRGISYDDYCRALDWGVGLARRYPRSVEHGAEPGGVLDALHDRIVAVSGYDRNTDTRWSRVNMIWQVPDAVDVRRWRLAAMTELHAVATGATA